MRLVRTVRALVLLLSLLLLALGGSVAHAQQRDADARLAYAQGREAYQSGKYDLALQRFRYCYTLSGEPALLYNISAALQNLNRPGDAADALQQYLTARPADPQRAELESRIASLRQSQTMLDKEAQHAFAATPALVFTTPPPGWMSDAESDKVIGDIRAKERRRHRKLGLGLGLGLGVIAVGGIIVGVVCGTGHCSSTDKDYDFRKNPVTP